MRDDPTFVSRIYADVRLPMLLCGHDHSNGRANLIRQFVLRAATESDRKFVEDVYFRTQRQIIEILFGWRGDDVERAKFAEFYDLPNTQLITSNGESIGWMTVVTRQGCIELEHLYLDPAHQNKGIGSALLHDLIYQAEALHRPLRLSTAKINRARRLYERLGFIEIAEDPYKVVLEGPSAYR